MFASPSAIERLRNKAKLTGCFINMTSPIAAELAARIGYDVVLLDQEHSPGDYFNALECMNGVKGTKAETWVRIPALDAVYIKRILDCGADGIMCPMIGSADDAKRLLSYCHFPPRGVRGVAPTLGRNTGYGMIREEYMARVGTDLAIMPQIESPEGVKNIDEIAAIDGIDVFFIGPMDLAASLGHFGKVDHPDVTAAIRHVEQAVRAKGKALSSLAMPGQDHTKLLERGYNLIFGGTDIGFLRAGMQEQFQRLTKPT